MKNLVTGMIFVFFSCALRADELPFSIGSSSEFELRRYKWDCEVTRLLDESINQLTSEAEDYSELIDDYVGKIKKKSNEASLEDAKKLNEKRQKVWEELSRTEQLKREVDSIENEQNAIREELYRLVISENTFNLSSKKILAGLHAENKYYVIVDSLRKISKEALLSERVKLKKSIKQIEQEVVTMIEQEPFPEEVPDIMKKYSSWLALNEAYEAKRSAVTEHVRLESINDESSSPYLELREIATARSSVRGEVCLKNYEKYSLLLQRWDFLRIQLAIIESRISQKD